MGRPGTGRRTHPMRRCCLRYLEELQRREVLMVNPVMALGAGRLLLVRGAWPSALA
ncbi:MAG: hypothetical protein NZU63_13395 [Gemmataceae bacterium]|nr:hypothetical protein [Gemmataceae bacterium]